MEDTHGDTAPLLMMGDLIRYFESQSRSLDKVDQIIIGSLPYEQDFTSLIKFSGAPILPPVMTKKRRDEMLSYKRQAQFLEKRVQSRQRTRLLARAQNILEDTQRTEASDIDTLSSSFSQALRVANVLKEEGLHESVPASSTLNSQDASPVPTLTNTGMTFATMGGLQSFADEPGLQTIDSLSSDLASLEDLSLPTDFSGMPLTSVKQQQISQNLARLSKGLNIQESQSLNSTGSSEVSEAVLKMSQGSPQFSAAKFYNPDNYSVNNSESSSVFHESQDTIVEVSQDAGNSTSGFISHVNSDLQTDGSGHNDSSSTANTSHSSANCSTSTVDSQKSSKSSPRSLKNTVHFANFVTEITRQSVEDNITLRKLEDTPTNSPRGPIPSNLKEPVAGLSAVHASAVPPRGTSGSMLSRVEFSPDADNTPSPQEQDAGVPFQGYSQDNEASTSDKENEQRPVVRRGIQLSSSVTSQDSSASARSSERYDSCQTSVSDSHSSQQLQSSVSDSYVSVPSREMGNKVSGVKQCVNSVSDSQLSITSALTTGISESESSTLRSENILSSKDSSCFTGPVNTASTDIGQFIRNIITDPVPQVNNSNSSQAQEASIDNSSVIQKEEKSKSFKKGHVRKGSYTLSEPSPVLLRSHGLTVKDQKNESVQQLNVPPDPSTETVNKQAQRKLDYAELEQMEPTSIPMPPGPEVDAKVNQINRYLSQIQSQTLSEGLPSPSISTNSRRRARGENEGSEALDSISIIQSLIESIESAPDADAGSLLNLHASKMEMLRQQMISQQRQELEELFVQQRREQMLLQQEVEAHQQRLKEQQDFLAENAPENLKKGVALNLSDGYLDQSEVKVQNTEHVSSQSLSNLNKSNLIKKTSAAGPKVHRPVLRSPMKAPSIRRRSGPVVVPEEVYHPEMKKRFDRVSAVAKGFLTRKLMQSEKVQELITTIKDTQSFAESFCSETPVKKGNLSHQDKILLDRISAQVQAALLDLHEIIFDVSVDERMSLIAHTRQLREDKRLKASGGSLRGSQPKISAATIRAIERKRKAQEAEAAVFGASTSRPRTAPPTTSSPRSQSTDLRALRPLQGQISPIRPDGNSPRNEKERPKTAPERGDPSRNRKLSIPSKTSSSSTAGKQSKSQTSAKTKPSTAKARKPDKAWR